VKREEEDFNSQAAKLQEYENQLLHAFVNMEKIEKESLVIKDTYTENLKEL
jgi:hypothetical protein